MKNETPNTDILLAMDKLKGLSESLGKVCNELSGINPHNEKSNIFDSITVEKKYPIKFKGKDMEVSVIKDKSLVIRCKGITDDEIKELLRKIHD